MWMLNPARRMFPFLLPLSCCKRMRSPLPELPICICWRSLRLRVLVLQHSTRAFRQKLWQVARRHSKSSGFYELNAMLDCHRVESAIDDYFDTGDDEFGFGRGKEESGYDEFL